RLPGRAADVMDVSAMPQPPSPQRRIPDPTRLIARKRLLAPARRFRQPPQEVMTAAHSVIQLDQQWVPTPGLTARDRALQDRHRIIARPLPHERLRLNEIDANPDFLGKILAFQQVGDQSTRLRSVSAPQGG